MNYIRNNYKSRYLIVTLCLVISVCALANSDVTGFLTSAKSRVTRVFQEQERAIVLERQFKKDPLEIKEAEVKERPVRFGEKFVGDSKWLKQAVLKIHNRYSKTITYAQINIDLPETQATGVMMQHQVFLGQHPVYNRPTNPRTLQLAPGESVKISLDSDYDEIKRMVELRNTPIDQITKVLVRLDEVGFEDGTIYSGGEILRRNPNPNASPKWLKVVE